jgi:hypothetical protein
MTNNNKMVSMDRLPNFYCRIIIIKKEEDSINQTYFHPGLIDCLLMVRIFQEMNPFVEELLDDDDFVASIVEDAI